MTCVCERLLFASQASKVLRLASVPYRAVSVGAFRLAQGFVLSSVFHLAVELFSILSGSLPIGANTQIGEFRCLADITPQWGLFREQGSLAEVPG